MEEQKKVLDLEWLNRSITSAQELKPVDFNHPLLRQAAMKIFFTEEEMQGWRELAAQTLEIQPDDLFALFWVLKSTSGVKYSMKDYVRNDVLKNIETKEQFDSYLKDTPVTGPEDETQLLFNLYITGTAPALDAQTLSQRVICYSIAQWLKNTIIPAPKAELVLSLIKQDEVLQPFRRLTANFKGRVKDLEMLSDYVDWLPKQGFISSAKSYFREIINWHDKPPLLITGIGGIGKSTLMAKFILQQVDNTGRGRLPFINLDFDKPGISVLDPITLIYEALRQLIQQFPGFSYLKKVRDDIKRQYFDNYQEGASRRSDREYLYERFLHLAEVENFLTNLKIPILLVFDSFEEVQTRFSQTELDNFFNFLQEINEQIPRLRTVFISRSDYITKAITFTIYSLGDFDETAAVAFLETLGVNDAVMGTKIYRKFGGNPLTLQLAGDLLQKERLNDGGQFKDIETSGIFTKIQENRVQEQLVKRNLDHIHDVRIRRIAFPGMIVRKITPAVIREVLAVPCGFGEISIDEAQAIFEDLKRESFLLTEVLDGVAFRQDLRVALYELIMQESPKQVMDIHYKAVSFYENSNEDSEIAEFLYHSLMRGDDLEIIDRYYDEQVGRYLNNSLSELPLDAYVRLAGRMGTNISEEKLNKASPDAWANYLENEIARSLKSSDFPALQGLYARIAGRSFDVDNVSYLLQFAKLAERIGNFEVQEGLLHGKLNFLKDKIRYIDFNTEKKELKEALSYFRLIVYHAEYFDEAMDNPYRRDTLSVFADYNGLAENLEQLFRTWRHEHMLMDGDEAQKSAYEWMDLCFVLLRYSKREREGTALCIRLIIQSTNFLLEGKYYGRKSSGRAKGDYGLFTKEFYRFLPLTYATAIKLLIDQYPEFEFPDYIFAIASFDRRSYKWERVAHNVQITNHRSLETLIKHYGKIHLKDICEPGTFAVNRVDVSNFIEAMEAWRPWKK